MSVVDVSLNGSEVALSVEVSGTDWKVVLGGEVALSADEATVSKCGVALTVGEVMMTVGDVSISDVKGEVVCSVGEVEVADNEII